jgi:hypothetical protein
VRDFASTLHNLDYLPMLAAANVNPSESPHQTYQYIRAAWAPIAAHPSTPAAKLAIGCQALGLFDPWPAGFLERGRAWETGGDPIPLVEVAVDLAGVELPAGDRRH